MPTAPRQSYDYHLNPVKGWPHPAALDFVAKQSSTCLYDLRAGQCCHVNSSGALEPGVSGFQMPLFIFQGVNEYDVNTASTDQWIPVMPRGNIMCLTAESAMELETTEFYGSLTYAPNDPLWAGTGLTAGHEGLSTTTYRPGVNSSGVLRNDSTLGAGIYGSDQKTVVGVVSRGVYTNYNKKQMLAFWPKFIPGKGSSLISVV